MRRSAFTNAELERKAADHRALLKTSYQLTPLYIATQIAAAEVFEELVDRRIAAGFTDEETTHV